MRRGQVAFEFLMTYGWAILVVLVAIGALAYFGVLNPSRYLPDKCVFTTGVTCKDFIFRQTGANDLNLSFTLTNNLGDAMIIGAGNVTATYGGVTAGCNAALVTVSIGADQAFTCGFTGRSPGVGQSAKASVAINYTLAQGVYPKSANGDISSAVQA